MSVTLVTLGCRLNLVESEAMKDVATASGLSDIVIVNTCAVTAEAVRQARQTIRKIKRETPNKKSSSRDAPPKSNLSVLHRSTKWRSSSAMIQNKT